MFMVRTCHPQDGPGIESRWGRDFPHPSRPALGPTQPPIQLVPSLFPDVKRPERGVDHPPPTSAKVKERVELYFHSRSRPSCPVLGWPLSLPLLYLVIRTRNLPRLNSTLFIEICVTADLARVRAMTCVSVNVDGLASTNTSNAIYRALCLSGYAPRRYFKRQAGQKRIAVWIFEATEWAASTLPAADTASITSTNTSSLDSSLNTTQEMEMLAVVLNTCRYPFTVHSPEDLPIVMIWHCSYAGSQSRKAENFITLFWGMQKRGNNIFCKFVRGFVVLIVRLPQRCLFLSHLFKREYTARTLVLNSIVKETTSAKECIFTEQTQNIFCCILSHTGRIQCDL